MPFCPDCKFEYLPQVKICPDCGAGLVEKLPDRSDEELENVKYVPLKNLPSRLYAEMLKEALEKEDIPCIIKGEDIGMFVGIFGTTSILKTILWVPESKLSLAEKIAEQILGDI